MLCVSDKSSACYEVLPKDFIIFGQNFCFFYLQEISIDLILCVQARLRGHVFLYYMKQFKELVTYSL